MSDFSSFILSALVNPGIPETAMRTFSQASPSIMSLPDLPVMRSLPPPPSKMSPPLSGLNTTALGSVSREPPTMLCKPAILSTPSCVRLLDSGTPCTGAVPTGCSVPVKTSSNFQPDSPSTRSKRSRRMNSCWLTKIGMPRSELAALGSPLWIAQSKPAMPLLRWMPAPCTMMSSPASPS
ncbi:hypothetical protein D3C86_1362290 [compost metagenome]